ncbi:HepT-like ribonuclease domain-containing protein [Desulfobacterium sp. N47]|uniref:Toxin-antitoxin system, antitoxin component n=1 Tax=uncultured Desulfobacterium sp. TaxID=201089 RepID=E1YJI2_9BACT|nr:hypothetical protein N47_E49480 [uncultured Desulfobacterium sp.]
MSDNFTIDNFESIYEAILLIEERFSEVSQAEDFVLSPHGVIMLDSIAMRLQVIGELVKKIKKSDPDIFTNFPNIEWGMIIRLRDIISHHYAVIDHEIIYDICKNHIPALKAAVSEILKK